MDLEFLQRLAKAITAEFGESSEVVVHDISGDDTEHTIAVIENGHVSHRQAGGSASRVVLEAIQRTSKRCYCPVVRDRPAKPSDLHCECTRATHQSIFEAALGRPVPVEVVETLRRGGKTCHFVARLA